MKKWFFRFLKAGFMALALLVLGAVFLYYWARPDPREIALVHMTVYPVLMKGAGFITNATGVPWIVYVASSNKATSEVRLTRIWLTTDRLQAVSYNTPIMALTHQAEFQIVYAKRLDPPKSSLPNNPSTLQPVRPSSSRPSPAQSQPLLPGPGPKAPGAATPAP